MRPSPVSWIDIHQQKNAAMRLEKQARFVNKEVTKCGTELKRKNAASHPAKQPAGRVVGRVVAGRRLRHMEIALPRQARNPRQAGIFCGGAMPFWRRLPTPKDGSRRSMPRPRLRKTWGNASTHFP